MYSSTSNEVFFRDLLHGTYYKYPKFSMLFQLGLVADPVIQATGRLEFEDGLRTGTTAALRFYVEPASALSVASIWAYRRSPERTRLTKELRNGPGGKPSSSK